ncbi:MAG: hypothetical protein CMH48_13495 [Muricauda sp.]|nr:hypothetical protein [Allomuricauda sp.]MAU27383.1 hypothetical protein [Allomuricauda sp.]MBC31843.1 hypothetical protein [Allomuricauda sp.]|tara:strand:+ start:634 stop:1194 length:561 start_codon:yes stop_codon:yes gene_type:complete
MKKQTHSILALALVFGLIFHGTSIFFTLESTYDALVHLFFAEHYSKDWFEPWDYRWYTGFTVHGYPPLVHQSMALLSYIGGLKFGLFSMSLIIISLFITGTYRFAFVITGSKKIAGYTALLGVFPISIMRLFFSTDGGNFPFASLPLLPFCQFGGTSGKNRMIWAKSGWPYQYLHGVFLVPSRCTL